MGSYVKGHGFIMNPTPMAMQKKLTEKFRKSEDGDVWVSFEMKPDVTVEGITFDDFDGALPPRSVLGKVGRKVIDDAIVVDGIMVPLEAIEGEIGIYY